MSSVKPSEVLDTMLTTRQAAEKIGVEEATLWNWRTLGIGPAYVKLHGSKNAPVRYMLSDLIDWQRNLTRIIPNVQATAEAAHGAR